MTQHITSDAIGKALHGHVLYAPHIEADATDLQIEHGHHGRITVSLHDQNDGAAVETRTYQIIEVF